MARQSHSIPCTGFRPELVARVLGEAMSQAQVERFVLFFERVSRQAERTLAGIADSIIDMDENRCARVRRR